MKFRFVKKGKPDPFLFLQNNSISQIDKKEIVSLTGLILSFSDQEYFILEFGMIKCAMS